MDLPSPLPTLLTLLPLLTSSVPTLLPFKHLATALRQSHYFLEPRLDSAEYFQLPTTSSALAQEIEGRRRGLGELGDGIYEAIGGVEWRCEGGEVRSRLAVGNEGLCVVLLWEEEVVDTRPGGASTTNDEESDRPAWTYLTMELLPTPSTAPTNPSTTYHLSLEAAVAHSTNLAAKSTTPIPIPSTLNRSSPPPTTLPPKKDPHDMADGEGTTPGAYGNSEDFWSGWTEDETDVGATESVLPTKPSLFVSHQVPLVEGEGEMDEDDDDDQFQSTGFCMNTVNARRSSPPPAPITTATPIQDSEHTNAADAEYWASYGDGGSSIGDDEYQRTDHSTAPPLMPTVPIVRPHRSSTIKAPIGIVSNPLPSLLARDVSNTGSTSSGATERPIGQALHRLPTPESPSTKSKSFPSSNQYLIRSSAEDGLRTALEGMWKLYRLNEGATSERFVEFAREISSAGGRGEL